MRFIRYFRNIHRAHRLGQFIRKLLYIAFHDYQLCSLFKSSHQKDDLSLHLLLYKVIRYFSVVHSAHRLSLVIRKPIRVKTHSCIRYVSIIHREHRLSLVI